MKKLTIIVLAILTISLFIPFFLLISSNEKALKPVSSPDEIIEISSPPEEEKESSPLSADDITYIATVAADFLEENDSKELKTAVLMICRNNYIFNEKRKEKLKISNYSDTLHDELMEMLKKPVLSISYQGKPIYIPLIRNGATAITPSEEYTYIVSVATPWEALEKSYSRFYDYPCGISISSMRYLIDNGLDAKEALSWHLPLCSIEK